MAATFSGVPVTTTVPPPCRPRPHIDDPVGVGDDVQVVLDDHHGVALVHQPLEHSEQLADVLEVQAGGRLVQDVDGAPGGAALELGGELDALGLAAESVVADWPSRTYPSPTSTRVLRWREMTEEAEKKSAAWWMVMSRTSATVLSL